MGSVIEMDFAQVQYFLAIAQTKRFWKAAERSYVSQSSLSKQIKSLEEELGVELFVRGPSGVSLTPAGETFLLFAERAYQDYEDVLLQLNEFDSTSRMRIRIGGLPLTTEYELHATLSDFQVDHLDTQIDFYEEDQSSLKMRLDINQLDVAILRTDSLSADQYDWIPLFKDEFVVVCNPDHGFCDRAQVPIEELKNEHFVLLDHHSVAHSAFVSECRRAGFVPNVKYRHSRHNPLLVAVARGLGISVLPSRLAVPPDGTCLKRIPLTQPLYTEIGLVWVRSHALSPQAESLIDHFRALFPSFQMITMEMGDVMCTDTLADLELNDAPSLER